MKYKKTISVLVPSELIYLFDADCEHLFGLHSKADTGLSAAAL